MIADDLDIYVTPPIGSRIYWGNRFDSVSGGRLDIDQVPLPGSNDEHVENIVFPDSGGPPGVYTFGVDAFSIRGAPDSWKLEVYENESVQAVYTGTGNGGLFSFAYPS